MDEDVAVGEGGPMDGRVLGAASAEHFEVTMVDDTQHRYERTDQRPSQSVIYTYQGRQRER